MEKLPKGIEMTQGSDFVYLHCLVCAMQVGVFNAPSASPDLILDAATKHTMSKEHLQVVRAVNSPKVKL